MKKTLAFLLAFMMIFSFCACGVESVDEHNSKVSSSEDSGEAALRGTDEVTESTSENSTEKPNDSEKVSETQSDKKESKADSEKEKNDSKGSPDVNGNSNDGQYSKPAVTTLPKNTAQSAFSYYVTKYETVYKTRYVTGTKASKNIPGTTSSSSSSSSKKPQTVLSGSGTKPGTSKSASKSKISVSQKAIDVSAILKNPDLKDSVKKSLPSDGILIPTYSKITVLDGSTVFDVLKLVMNTEKDTYKNQNAVFEYRSSGYGNYIYSICGLSEKDCGTQSGWTYKVNGKAPGVSCDKYVLKSGDIVEWVYVTNS